MSRIIKLNKKDLEDMVARITAQGGEFITRKQAAELIGCDVSTIWRWEKQGIIKRSSSVMGRPRFRKSDIVNVLNGQADE